MKFELLSKVLGTEVTSAPKAKPNDSAGKPLPLKQKKEALKEFSKPEMSEARFYIRKTNAIGGDWWDVRMSIPVSVDFLNAKQMDLKLNEFSSYNSSDPIDILVMMGGQELQKHTGAKFSRPSMSPVDLQRQRAKNGMKTVEVTWQVTNPLQAYASGLDLTEWSGSAEVVKSPAEYAKRYKQAEDIAQESLELRQAIKDGSKPETDWKPFVDKASALGLNYDITKLHKLAAALDKFELLSKVLGTEITSENKRMTPEEKKAIEDERRAAGKRPPWPQVKPGDICLVMPYEDMKRRQPMLFDLMYSKNTNKTETYLILVLYTDKLQRQGNDGFTYTYVDESKNIIQDYGKPTVNHSNMLIVSSAVISVVGHEPLQEHKYKTYTWYLTGDEYLDLDRMPSTDGRWNLFKAEAPKKFTDMYARLEDINYKTEASQLVNDFCEWVAGGKKALDFQYAEVDEDTHTQNH